MKGIICYFSGAGNSKLACNYIKNKLNKKMSIISFGEYIVGKKYKVLDERRMRASAGIMLLLGVIAFINAYFA